MTIKDHIEKFGLSRARELDKVDRQETKSREVFSEVLKREERKLNEVSLQNSSKKES